VHGFHDAARVAYEHVRRLDPKDWRWPYFEGMCLRRTDLAAAADAFGQALRSKPDHVPLRVEYADCLFRLDRLEDARDQFTRARDADPKCAPAWRGLAQLALRDDRLDDAERCVNEALELAGRYKAAHEVAAEVARRAGNLEKAKQHRALAERCPDEVPLPDVVRDALWWQEGVSPKWRRLRCAQHRKAGRFGEAVKEWRALLADEPGSPVALTELAVALARAGRSEDAVAAAKAAIAAGADELVVSGGTGGALAGAGAAPAAVPLLERAVALAPRDLGVRADLGSALAMTGRTADAIDHLTIAAAAAEPDVRVLLNLAQALGAERRHADAARVLETVAEREPRNRFVYERLAMQRMRARDPAGALRACRDGVAKDPGNVITANRLAWLLATIPEDSLRDGAEALRIATALNQAASFNDAILLDTLAAAHAEVGAFDEALKASRKAVALSSGAAAAGKLDRGLAQRMGLRLQQYYSQGRKYRGPP
jgi:predicted Zn-dependent protease